VWLGIMTVISQLTWVAIAPLWGFVMDRYGRKPAVLMGFLVGLTTLGYIFLTQKNYAYVLLCSPWPEDSSGRPSGRDRISSC